MGLLNILRSGIKTANKVTRDLQCVVVYQKAVPDGLGYGNFTYPTSANLHAIVDYTARQVRGRDGVLTISRATVDLLDIDEVRSATGGEGIRPDDRIILPNGDTGPIITTTGFLDRETETPVVTTVMLG